MPRSRSRAMFSSTTMAAPAQGAGGSKKYERGSYRSIAEVVWAEAGESGAWCSTC